MSLDRKIIEELKRFNQINTYILNEQPEPPAPPAPVDLAAAPGSEPPIGEPEGGMPPPADDAAPPAGDVISEPIDIENDLMLKKLVMTLKVETANQKKLTLLTLLQHNKRFKLNKMSLWMAYFLS
jgi:hypothetical protein